MTPAPNFHILWYLHDAFSLATCRYLERLGIIRWHTGHVPHDKMTWYSDTAYRVLHPQAYARILPQIEAVMAKLQRRGLDHESHTSERFLLIIDKALKRYRGQWYGPNAERPAPPVPMLANEPDVLFEYLAGQCPVQAEGTVDGVPFYFRSRGKRWSFTVGGGYGHPNTWSYAEDYGTRYEAGWITQRQALAFIATGVAQYRARNDQVAQAA
jgi:hypothetical protein